MPITSAAARRTKPPVPVRASHPARTVFLGFAAAGLLGTGLLMLPMAKRGPGGAAALEALFTAISALCVTGLVVVDTPTFWTPFGHVVIVALIQLGGLGVMTFASVVGVSVMRRLSLRSKLTAATEVKSLGIGDIGSTVLGVVKISLLIESAVAIMLTARFAIGYGHPLGEALWLGVFHAVSSFNNAGFALFSDSLMSFQTDPFVCLPICAAIILGGSASR
ncbi:potassium transporter TrkG [Propionibacteriaceae bacterium Y2011]